MWHLKLEPLTGTNDWTQWPERTMIKVYNQILRLINYHSLQSNYKSSSFMWHIKLDPMMDGLQIPLLFHFKLEPTSGTEN